MATTKRAKARWHWPSNAPWRRRSSARLSHWRHGIHRQRSCSSASRARTRCDRARASADRRESVARPRRRHRGWRSRVAAVARRFAWKLRRVRAHRAGSWPRGRSAEPDRDRYVFAAQPGFWLTPRAFGSAAIRTTRSSMRRRLIRTNRGLAPPQEQAVLATGRGAVIRPGCVYGGRAESLQRMVRSRRAEKAALSRRRRQQSVGDGQPSRSRRLLRSPCRTATHRHLPRRRRTNETLLGCALAVASGCTIETIPIEVARQKYGSVRRRAGHRSARIEQATRAKLGWSPKREFTSSLDEQWAEWRASRA